MSGNEDLIAEYLGEVHEYIEKLNQALLSGTSGADSWSSELVNDLFRTAHSMKGLSACFGFDRTNRLTHQLETLLSHIRDGRVRPRQDVVRAMFNAIDLVSHLTAEIAGNGTEFSSIDLAVGELERICERGHDGDSDGAEPAAEAATAAAATPPAAAGAAVVAGRGSDATETVRVRMDRLDRLVNMTGELVITRSRFQVVGRTLRGCARLGEMTGGAAALLEGLQDLAEIVDGDERGRHTAARLIDLAQTLRQACGELAAVPTALKELESATYDLDGVVSGIHDAVLQVRMVPLENVFRRLQRVVRDTAEVLGKDVQLEIVGGDTQIDKRMADELVNPLVHLLRNAVDHGLETPAVRTTAGKARHGTIAVQCYQRGSSVVIDIADDGAGIDCDRVARKAIDMRLVTAEEAAAMTPAEIQRLILRPGFSTAAKVTEVSGRGMGMDIVDASIKKLRGSLEVASEHGRGTRMTISLPPSMSILTSLLLEVRGTTFALPLTEVQEIVELSATRRQRVQMRDMVVVRERPMPLVALPRVYRFPAEAGASTPTHAVVLGSGRNEIALGVDRLLGKEDLVIKPVCPELAAVRGLAGMAIRGDGHVTLILEPTSFAEHALERHQSAAPDPTPNEPRIEPLAEAPVPVTQAD